MSDTMKKIVRLGSIILGIVLIAAFMLRGVSQYQSYKTSMANGDLSIAEYQKQLLMDTARLEELSGKRDEESAHVNNMTEIGNKIAARQNEYAKKADAYGVSQAVRWDSIDEDLSAIRKDLQQYFDDADIYLWYDWDSLKKHFKWTCVTTYDVVGDTIDAMWVCLNGNDVMAYATALFDVKSQHFSNLNTYITKLGQKYLVLPEETEEPVGSEEFAEVDTEEESEDVAADVTGEISEGGDAQ